MGGFLKKLTSLLHFKQDTDNIKIQDYIDIFDKVFSQDLNSSIKSTIDKQESLKDIILSEADSIKQQQVYCLGLEQKILMSMAIRLKTEFFLIKSIRKLKNEEDYWCKEKNQFSKLINEFKKLKPNHDALKVCEKVKIMRV